MLRISIATALGLSGFTAYVIAVVTLADRVFPLHWALQSVYFLGVGVLWVMPAYWLMLWAARR
ncbi:MAG: DUF2842 domain-containing protein [Acidisphaera sp.]|nr:DUF2842 domain-containing protein [Acidisphaera sp.]